MHNTSEKLELKRTRRFPFFKYEWRYTITDTTNGLVIGASTQGYSRRIDLEANIRRKYNQNIIDQLNKLLEKTQRE